MSNLPKSSYAAAAFEATGYQRVWYKLVNKDNKPYMGFTVESVRLLPGSIVSDLKKEVKKENIVYLNESAFTDTKEPLMQSRSLNDIGQTESNALLVVVPDVSGSKQRGSTSKQIEYKGWSAGSYCREYLEEVAREIGEMYDFETKYKNPTMGDILDALDSGSWDIRVKKGKQVTNVPLDKLFTVAQWKILRDLNSETNKRLHRGTLPINSRGHKYMVVPHNFYSEDSCTRLTEIAMTVDVVFEMNELEIRDDIHLSGSSGSEGGSPK